MIVHKHICVRHDGMVTIIPDARTIHTGIWEDDYGNEHDWVYITRTDNKIVTLWRATEVSSPYKQEQCNEVQA